MGSIIVLICSIIFIVVGFIRYDFAAILYGIVLVVCFFSARKKEELCNKYEEKIKALETKHCDILASNDEKIHLLNVIIIQSICDCDFYEAKEKLNLMEGTGFFYEFKNAETFEEKRAAYHKIMYIYSHPDN